MKTFLGGGSRKAAYSVKANYFCLKFYFCQNDRNEITLRMSFILGCIMKTVAI